MNVTFSQYKNLLVKYLRPCAGGVALLAGLLGSAIALGLAGPQVIRHFIDTAQTGGQPRTLLLAAFLFIGVSLVQQVAALGAKYTSQNIGWKATNQLRTDLALHCLRLDMDFHKARTPGELIERIDGDVNQLAGFFSNFTVHIVGHSLLAVGILGMLFLEDARVGLALSLYVVLVMVLMTLLQRVAMPYYAAGRQASAEQYGFIEERISGAEDIRAIAAESAVLHRLYGLMRTILITHRASLVIQTLAHASTDFLFALGYAAGLALGVLLYLRGEASLGAAYLIVTYTGMLAWPLQEVRQQVQDLQQAGASIQRIYQLLDLQPKVQSPARRQTVGLGSSSAGLGRTGFPAIPASPAGLQSAGAQPLAAAFHDVSFGYNGGEHVLHNLSFSLPAGKILGVLGRTGSGKTSLVRLLFRLYDPASGTITLDGADLRSLSLEALRDHVGMVTQDVQLFQASIRDNLTFFNPGVPEAALRRALEQVGMWEWAAQQPGGLDAVLAAGGEGLSAGEAQLLSFARILLKDPGLVILDEASSRLDPATEARLERALDHLFEGRTGLIIAHRLETVQRADDILVLEKGRAAEYGPRLELAADPDSRYARLLRSGLDEEGLAQANPDFSGLEEVLL